MFTKDETDSKKRYLAFQNFEAFGGSDDNFGRIYEKSKGTYILDQWSKVYISLDTHPESQIFHELYYRLWQYRLWSFQGRDTKLKRF